MANSGSNRRADADGVESIRAKEERVFERVVSKKMEGTRLDQYLVKSGIGLSRSQVEKLIKAGVVLVNNKPSKPGYRVREGDHIYAEFELEQSFEVIPEQIDIPIIYEDKDIIVVNKPPGMVTHPARGNLTGTLINAILWRIKNLPNTGDRSRPGVVHRLDKDTSGVIVVAKSERAVRSLARQIELKKAQRIYWAVVWGSLPLDSSVIEAPIGRHMLDRKRMAVTPFSSRPAITEYTVLERFGKLATFVEVRLRTGRTHQIRVHFEFLGYPIVGDPVYSGREVRKIFKVVPPEYVQFVRDVLQIIDRQALHARKLVLTHPSTGLPVEFEAPLPEDFRNLLEYLRNKFRKS